MDPSELEAIWTTRIKPRFDRAPLPAHGRPVTVLLGGQPGAGKTTVSDHARHMYPNANITPIVGDDFRREHPDYDRLVLDDPMAMPAITAEAAGRWTGMSIDHCRQRGTSLLIEGTWRNPQTVLEGAEQSARAGHYVHAMIVAVQPEISRLDCLKRYYAAMERGAAARWTPPQAHDAAVAGIPASITALTTSPHVHRFSIATREGTLIYDDQDNSRGPRAAVDTLRRAQHQPLAHEDLQAWVKQASILHGLHARWTHGHPHAEAVWNRIIYTDQDTLRDRATAAQNAAFPSLTAPEPAHDTAYGSPAHSTTATTPARTTRRGR